MSDVAASPASGTASLPFSVHLDTVPALPDRAQRSPRPVELVVTAVRPHRRTLRDLLRDADLPQSGFAFARPVAVARQVAGTANVGTEALDRIDRLRLVEAVLVDAREEGAEWYTALATSMGTNLPERVEAVEALRGEVETLTGFHPDRLATLRREAGRVDADAAARIDAAVAIQRALADRAAVAPSSGTVVRNAVRELAAHGDDAWREAYESVDRVTVAGVATVSASLADLLRVLGAATSADVHLHLRAATGPVVRDRLAGLCSVADPGAEVVES